MGSQPIYQEIKQIKIALIRSPPPNWPLPLEKQSWEGITLNIDETIDEGIKLIKLAKSNGADLVSFPELWFPGFPKWREINDWKKTHLGQYLDNSLVVGSDKWDRIVGAIKESAIWTALAFSELKDDRLYMSQALISPVGEIVNHRHKVRPSGSERDMFTDGGMSGLRVFNTEIGRLGMMECGEHFYPAMSLTMAAQRPKLHLGCFPFITDFGDEKDSYWYNAALTTRASGSYAFMSGAYCAFASVGYTWIYDPLMRIIKHVDASVPFDEVPIMYHTFENAHNFHSNQIHDPDAQVSWGSLQQISENFPKNIPKEQGSLVPFRETSVEWLRKFDWEWSEIAPGTPNPNYKKK